ncbi:MAG: glycosyltransferase family 2 protein [bacterium]
MNKTLPKVSIILPTYNGADYIHESIGSCLNQTYKNLELIIVDDGSTDGTDKIVNDYKDNRINVIKNKNNKGLPNALNIGFSQASGDFLTWTSDDNMYDKEAIEKMLHFLIEKKCSFVYCNYYKFTDPESRSIVNLPEKVCLETGNMIGPCFMYSRKVMESIGEYDPVTELAEDYDFWIRVAKVFSMEHISEPLYFFRVHGESLSKSKYYEVLTVGFLVMLKNNISSIDHVTDLFLDLIRQKKEGLIRPFILIKILYTSKIKRILREYESGILNFNMAKLDLYNIVFSKIPHTRY